MAFATTATKISTACALLALSLAALPLPAPAQGQLPTLGDGSDMTSAAERRLGDKIARELYRDPDYVDDPVVVEYVLGLWERLLGAARARGELTAELDERFAWQVLMGRDRSINAFALPGGYLGVHAGLVAITASPAELASVLAHEMSHVTQRHIARLMTQESRQMPLMIASMLVGALAMSRSPQLGNAMMVGGTALSAQNQLNFSRDMEREADRIGYGVMTQAGFEGQGFASMFEKLQQASRINDNGSFPYLRSHPLNTERIADMRARTPLGERGAASGDLLEHVLIAARARVIATGPVDSLRAWATEPDSGGFAALPRERQAGALYMGALSHQRQRDFAAARRHAARLLTLVQAQPGPARQARLLSAEIEIAAGDGPAALRALAAGAGPRDAGAAKGGGPLALDAAGIPPFSAVNPGGRRSELLLYAQAAALGGPSPHESADRLQTWVAGHPRDGTAWQLLAAAYRADGQPLRALRAEAEAQVAHLDWAGAVDRYRAGQELMRAGGPAADYVEASIIDTRLREAESRLREQAAER